MNCYFAGFFVVVSGLLMCAGCSNPNNLNCVYTPMQSDSNPQPQLSPFKACAHFDESGALILAKKHLENLYYDGQGLASVRLKGAIYYVGKKTGKAVQTHFIDNGPDYFHDGLARFIEKGKYGFVDPDLNIVITAAYDYAAPFNNGLSAVCDKCSPIKHGAHSEMSGGVWGYIDKAGKEVVPVKFEHDKLKLPTP